MDNPVWVETFDYSERHCWESDCNNASPLKHGNTEFIRWIRNFGTLTDKVVTGFYDDNKDWLKLGPDFSQYEKREIYCENYGNVLKAFLDMERRVAIVELYDNNLAEAATVASVMTEKELFGE